MPLLIRPAVDDDYPALARLSVHAYPFVPDSAAARADRYRESVRVLGAERFVVERDRRHVGQYACFPFTGWWGGVASPVGGLASVAVAPEARRTGVAAAILRHHLDHLRARRAPWSMLYPFAARFYAAHGWSPVAQLTRWRFAPDEIPLHPERAAVERLDLADGKTLAAVQRAYERSCARTNGSLSRPAADLAARWSGERRVVVGVRDGDEIAGYLLAVHRAPTARPQTLVVPEWVADDARACRALLGFLAAQADQVAAIELDAPVGEPIGALLDRRAAAFEPLESPEGCIAEASVWSGAMARVVDLAGALAGRGYPGGDGRVSFAARDPDLPENDREVVLTVDGGVPRVEPGRARTIVRGPIGAVTQVLTGALPLAAAARFGRLAVEGDLAAASRMLALPPPFPLVAF